MEFLPKFREIDLFAITLSLIIVFILYSAEAMAFIGQILLGTAILGNVQCLVVFGIAFLVFIYVQFLSVKYALVEGVPDDVLATLMVLVALATLIPFSLAGALQVYMEFLRSSNIIDLLPIIFPLLAFARSAIVFGMFLSLNNYGYARLFDYDKDAAGAEVPAALVAAGCAGLVVRFFTDYPFLLAFLVIYWVSVMAANIASEKSK